MRHLLPLVVGLLAPLSGFGEGPVFQGYSPSIDHPWLPLSKVRHVALLGRDATGAVEIDRSVDGNVRRIAGALCLTLVESIRVHGSVAEVRHAWYAEKDGSVALFGEEVDRYAEGRVKDHLGSWTVGKEVEAPLLLVSAKPRKGDRSQGVRSGAVVVEAEVIDAGQVVVIEGRRVPDVVTLRVTNHAAAREETWYLARDAGVLRLDGPGKTCAVPITTAVVPARKRPKGDTKVSTGSRTSRTRGGRDESGTDAVARDASRGGDRAAHASGDEANGSRDAEGTPAGGDTGQADAVSAPSWGNPQGTDAGEPASGEGSGTDDAKPASSDPAPEEPPSPAPDGGS